MTTPSLPRTTMSGPAREKVANTWCSNVKDLAFLHSTNLADAMDSRMIPISSISQPILAIFIILSSSLKLSSYLIFLTICSKSSF